jgi:hypothetical protein
VTALLIDAAQRAEHVDAARAAVHHPDADATTFAGWATCSGISLAAPKITGRIAQLAMEEEITPRRPSTS